MPCVPWIPWYLNRYPRKKNWFLNLYPPKKQLQAPAGDDLHRNQTSIQPGMQETVFLCICVHQEFLFTSTVSYCLWTDRKDWYYRIHILLNFALITHIFGSSVSYSQAPCLYAAFMKFNSPNPWNPWTAKSIHVYIHPMKCTINAACSSRETEVISKIWRRSNIIRVPVLTPWQPPGFGNT